METQRQQQMQEYRQHLTVISNGLMDMAKAAGRKEYKVNQLLRECYNLVDLELHTFDEWAEKGFYPRKGQHAYLFWNTINGDDRDFKNNGIMFLFCHDQVEYRSNE